MAMTEDLSAFFNTAEFAYEAVWNGTVTLNVILDKEYAEVLGMAGSNPTYLAVEAEMPGALAGQAVHVNGVDYLIAQAPQPDGTGLVRIELELA